jgi:hypothetical protein
MKDHSGRPELRDCMNIAVSLLSFLRCPFIDACTKIRNLSQLVIAQFPSFLFLNIFEGACAGTGMIEDGWGLFFSLSHSEISSTSASAALPVRSGQVGTRGIP